MVISPSLTPKSSHSGNHLHLLHLFHSSISSSYNFSMCCYKPTKFAFSIIKPNKNPIQESIFLTPIHQYPYYTKSNFFEFNKLVPPFFRRPSIFNHGLFNPNQANPFLQNGSNRFYCADKLKVDNFRPKGLTHWLKSMFNQCWETVPYTKRKHFVLLSKQIEREVGERKFNKIKDGFKDRILPATHPQSVRVRLIATNIIESAEKELNKEQVLSSVDDALKALSNEAISGGNRRKANEVLDHKGAKGYSRHVGVAKGNRMCRLMAGKGRSIPSRYSCLVPRERGHSRPPFLFRSNTKGKRRSKIVSEGLNWEVVVVDDPKVNAACMPGGKIVVYTGMLEQCTSDAEVASMIGHEVGHLLARHYVEMTTKDLGFVIMLLVLYQFVTPYLLVLMSTLFLRLYLRRRMEMEADYIGVMLIASAGYDPWVASTNFAKLAKLQRRSELQSTLIEFISMHPSRKKRALLLAQAEVMDKALLRYRETQAGKDVEGCR